VRLKRFYVPLKSAWSDKLLLLACREVTANEHAMIQYGKKSMHISLGAGPILGNGNENCFLGVGGMGAIDTVLCQ